MTDYTTTMSDPIPVVQIGPIDTGSQNIIDESDAQLLDYNANVLINNFIILQPTTSQYTLAYSSGFGGAPTNGQLWPRGQGNRI